MHADEYAGYNSVRDITRVGCMAHAKIKFTDGITAIPKNAAAKATLANEAFKLLSHHIIIFLYTFERNIIKREFER